VKPEAVSADERQLIEGVLSKDRKATAEFVDCCTDWIYPFIWRRVVPRSEFAEDIMQDILVAAWQALPSFRGDASLRSWILSIARHKVDDYYRRRIREAETNEDETSGEEPSTAPLFDEQLDVAAQQAKVHETLSTLPEAYAAALLWRYRDDKSVREMAELTGKTEKAMERLLARAREAFRKRWNHA
jgi:RNA polymerase sigma factor (sigma-70 family)